MRIYIHRVTIVLAVLSSLGNWGPANAQPAPTACVLLTMLKLEELPNGALVQPIASSELRRHITLQLDEARKRIDSSFGQAIAHPTVAVIQDTRASWPISLPKVGGANFIGTHSCLILGPDGQNVDVMAHELLHAELFERVGPLKRLTQIPTWFDEGLAMQVDMRSKFDMSQQLTGTESAYVRKLTSFRAFFNVNEVQLVRNYAAAKAEVAQLLADVGVQTLYQRLERMKNGETFETAFTK